MIKANVSCVNLLSSEDGVIASIRKSHQLMDNRFWQCFGFIFCTGVFIFIAFAVSGGLIGASSFLSGLFHSDPHQGAKLYQLASGLGSIPSTILLYYYQTWQYVYLKKNPIVKATP